MLSSPRAPLPIRLGLLLLLAAPVAPAALPAAPQEGPAPSQPEWPEIVVESQYVAMSDGVRLAVDVYRPARDGVPCAEPLPVLWSHDRYQRATDWNGQRHDKTSRPAWRELVSHGYVAAAVDVRGAGASFGVYRGPFHPQETGDARDVMQWFVEQPWCDGNVGMWGGSYLGATQLMAAASGSPHLKAIVPHHAPGDLYSFVYPGGVFREEFLQSWGALTAQLDREVEPWPVDADPDRALLREARAQHAENRETLAQFRDLPFRDSREGDLVPHADFSTLSYREAIGESGVAILHVTGWFDTFTRDTFLAHANLPNPQQLWAGPWFHGDGVPNYAQELVRWFDHWLKGVDNGVMDGPPLHLFRMDRGRSGAWRTAETWPLPEAEPREVFLYATRSSPWGGALRDERPEAEAAVTYTVDYGTTSGTSNRWRNGYGGPGPYADLDPNDRRGMCFTGMALREDLEVAGHPVAHLWIASSVTDGDFFVYLEEVDVAGVSHYVTEGTLRASHRALAEPPHENLGLPWHRSHAEDVEPLVPGEPVLLVLELQPTWNVFDAGNSLRVTVTCADSDNLETPVLDPAPVVTLFAAGERASRVVLPVLD